MRVAVGALVVCLCSTAPLIPARAQTPQETDSLRAEVDRLVGSGKYAEAIPLAQKRLALLEASLGAEHPDVATALNNLAYIYKNQGRLADAEPLYTRSIGILEKTLGAEHPHVATNLNNLAELYRSQSRYAEAETLYQRSIAIHRAAQGPDHVNVATSLNNLASLYRGLGRYADAEPLYTRSIGIFEKALGAEHPHVAATLNNLATLYINQGRYAEAEPLYTRSITIFEKVFGPNHPRIAVSLSNFAEFYRIQARYADAEPLYKRSIVILATALGEEHPQVGISLKGLADLYVIQGRYAEAEPLYKRSLAIHEAAFGAHHPQVASSLGSLAGVYMDQGRYAEAEPHLKRSLTIQEAVLGPEHPDLGTTLSNLGTLYLNQGRYSEAEPSLKRSLAIRENALGAKHPDLATGLGNLAQLYKSQGRYAEAEPLYKRSLSIYEAALGLEHPDLATSLNNLAGLYMNQGRHADAEPLYKRSLTIREAALGSKHPDVATSLNNLAGVYVSQARNAEAERLYKRSLAIHEAAIGPEHPDLATGLNNLGFLYQSQGRYAEAEPLFKRSLAIREAAYGVEHPDTATSLNNLASFYSDQGRYTLAKPLYARSLAIFEKALGVDHPLIAVALNNLATLALTQNEWQEATRHWRASTAILQRRVGRNSVGATESPAHETQRSSRYFVALVKASTRAVSADQGDHAALGIEMFETAQWAQSSEAAASLAQMAVRTAAGTTALSHLVRERQDLAGEWRDTDKRLISARSQAPDQRDAPAERTLVDRLSTIDARLARIDTEITIAFPDYATLVSPTPLALADAQSSLRNDEALIFFLDTPQMKAIPEETFIWVVTRTGHRWVRSKLGTQALQSHVAALRCGLADDAWQGYGQSHCNTLLGRDPQAARPHLLPFDLARAHTLYQGLFGEVEDMIKGKHLIVVPSGPLTQLPFQVLVTAAPKSPSDYVSAAWLAKTHAVTVLPSVPSLLALRRNAKNSSAPEPFIGYGNPVLSGHPACGTVVVPDRCPDEEGQAKTIPGIVDRITATLASLPSFFRDGRANVEEVRKLCPLPDTAHELKCVARSLKAPQTSIVLADHMTEASVKKAPLDRYRVIHFATHGLLSGETAQLAENMAEPALVFTPPAVASEEDDGLLTASEIAGLKLDAEWVVMSACNTAAGGAPGAETLSGLARAFFYAGARALLVSHWPVNSYAATLLTSQTFAEMETDPTIGRAEGFRRASVALMSDKRRPWAAHPSIWAPFVVVGEGQPIVSGGSPTATQASRGRP